MTRLLGILLLTGRIAPAAATAEDWAARVQTDMAALTSESTLAQWQAAHTGDRIEPAHYGNSPFTGFNGGHPDIRLYGIDYMHQHQWCASALVNDSSQVLRVALFYVPAVQSGALPLLPATPDPRLTGQCRMEGLWFQVRENIADQVVHELSAAWGIPNGPEAASAHIQGCGLWIDNASWRRGDVDIWAGYDPMEGRTLVFANRNTQGEGSIVRALFDEAFGRRVTAEALSIAGLGAKSPETPEALEKWLADAAALPPARQAAALLVADAFDPPSAVPQERLAQLGLKFAPYCPQDGPVYSHNLRADAERIDPTELSSFACLIDICRLPGKNNWTDRAIAKGSLLLIHFPESKWTPWFHYAVARAHAIKLAYADPAEVADDGPHPLSEDVQRGERLAAIDHFRAFLRLAPGVPEAVFAWQEAWKLLAGLPPDGGGFGCGCE